MNNYYFTFGQDHVHRVNDIIFNKDCIVLIKAENSHQARDIMFNTFGDRWSFQYDNEPPNMDYFPRGIIEL